MKTLKQNFCNLLGFALLIAISIFFSSQVLAQAASTVLYQINLPQPSGSYSIGTTSYALTDSSRDEIFTKEPNDKRDIFVQCWYPAQSPKPSEQPVPIWGKNTKLIVEKLGVSGALSKKQLDEVAKSPSHSYLDAPLAKSSKPFPVLFYSHGYGTFAAQNTAQMQELASQGYIVFSIGHLYEGLVVFPDGRTVPASPERTAEFSKSATPILPIMAKMKTVTDLKEKKSMMIETFNGWKLFGEDLKIWMDDTFYVVNEITKWNAPKSKSIFAKTLDLKRIGFFGMSFGGAVSAEICLADKRCRAGINMDGIQLGNLLTRPLETPFMFMQSEEATGANRLFYEEAENDAYFVEVKGSKHMNYSDYSLFPSEFQKNILKSSIEGSKMETFMNSYILAFFDKYLKGKKPPLLEKQPDNSPEIMFLSRKLAKK